MTASGGIGSLLQIWDAGKAKTYLPAYDGNGNVAAMLDAAASGLATVVQAAYEYTPFGQLLRSDGDYTVVNPFRFSTKYTDLETKLTYYGHRYYSAELGRFINRDPIQEQGGLNLYGFCGNDGVNHWDYLGQWSLKKFFKKIARIVSPILTIIGMFNPVFAPFALAINAGISAAAGVPLGEIVKGLAVGLVAGAIGGKIAGSIVGKTATLAGSVVTGALGGAIGGAIGSAVLGGDMGTAVLTGAAMGAIGGFAKFKLDQANQQPIVQKPESNQSLAPGQNGSLAAHGSDINVTPNQTFSEGSGLAYAPQGKVILHPLQSPSSWDGYTQNANGSYSPANTSLDYLLDYMPRSASSPISSGTSAAGEGFFSWDGVTFAADGVAAIAGVVELRQDGTYGQWMGKNRNLYPNSWGGNGETGGRLAFAGKMAGAARTAGNTLGGVSLLISGVKTIQAYRGSDWYGVSQGVADLGVGALGFSGPHGWALSFGYFVGQSVDRIFGVSDKIASAATRHDWVVNFFSKYP